MWIGTFWLCPLGFKTYQRHGIFSKFEHGLVNEIKWFIFRSFLVNETASEVTEAEFKLCSESEWNRFLSLSSNTIWATILVYRANERSYETTKLAHERFLFDPCIQPKSTIYLLSDLLQFRGYFEVDMEVIVLWVTK